MYNEESKKYGGTLAHAQALLNLDPDKGTPSTSLGPKMGMQSTSLSRTLKSMEELKLISRVNNPNDKRGVLIKLTRQGLELRNLAKKNGYKFNKVVYDKIGKKDLEVFLDVMNKINIIIKNKEGY
jgi:DNA-binding MarR family transcriptional regulator